MKPLKDVQNLTPDIGGISIQKVGVKNVHIPLQILAKNGDYQQLIARVSLGADLTSECRGTHMSRFMEILTRWSRKPMSSVEVREILDEVKKSLGSMRAQIVIHFLYFVEKSAPVTGSTGYMDYDCRFCGIMEGDKFSFVLGVKVPVQLVCPCSREISKHGAHNQRADVNISLEYYPGQFIWLEDLISDIESAGSSGVYPVVKREDEKFLTEASYENAKFVEDVIRDLVDKFRSDERIRWFEAECDSHESIHNHNAFAYQKEYRGEETCEICKQLISIPDLHFMFD